ncbi:hypothetical protein ACH5RR_008521 [Cinchona calisaya]|uniref:Uncharacterized protein n=1 Tax=Cinchona calisaya TaxID=153742 RepID=A0ABD3ABU3_9GENT
MSITALDLINAFLLEEYKADALCVVTRQTQREDISNNQASDQAADQENNDEENDSRSKDDMAHDLSTDAANDSPKLNIVHIGTKTVAIQLLRGTKVVYKKRIEFPVTAFAISPDGTGAVLGGADGKLHIYSVIGKNGLQKEVDVRKPPVFTSIFYSADGSKIVAQDVNGISYISDN